MYSELNSVELENEKLRGRTVVELVAWATRLYNTAYHAGHHGTVEGDYTHVYPQDMDSYHEDIVQEWMEENPQPAPGQSGLAEAAVAAKNSIKHLLHNIKVSGKRIDMGPAKESAEESVRMIDAALATQGESHE